MKKRSLQNSVCGWSVAKQLLVTVMLLSTTGVSATPMYYTFEGLITGFQSYNSAVSLDDYDVLLGQTMVSYVFEVDFERNAHETSNSAGTWQRFYSDLLSDAIVDGLGSEINESFDFYNNNHFNLGSLQGGSTVRIQASELFHDSWRVEDWFVGQQLKLIDGGLPTPAPGGAVYFFGDVELTSISSTLTVPEPGTLALLVVALAGCTRWFRLRPAQAASIPVPPVR